jgi:predicted Zn-dependent peptidase
MKVISKKNKKGTDFIFVKKDFPSVTVLVLVRSGSEYEKKKNNGISHFIEHLCFKGTKTFPNYKDLLSEFDRHGIEYNAFTSYEYIGYWARGSYDNLDNILFLVNDILVNSIFPEEEIEKEKGVIIEEMNLYKDTPARYIWDLFLNTLYGDQPAGWPIIGLEENIKKTKKQDILNYYNKFYNSKNIVVIVAGNLKDKDIKKIFEKFSNIKEGERSIKPSFNKPKLPKIKIEKKEINQFHLGFGFLSFSIKDKNYIVASLLSKIIGGMMSSRMFLEIREKLGAAYYIRTENDGFIDHGYLATFAGIKKELIYEALDSMVSVYKSIRNKIEKDEFEKAKENMIAKFIMSLEMSTDYAWFFGIDKILKGKIEDPKEIIKKIKEIKIQQVEDVARKIINKNNAAISLIGEIDEKKIRKFLEKL